MARRLKVDFDVFEQTISQYQESIDLFEDTLNKLNASMDTLKGSGWDTAASEVFFNTFDNKWKYNMELHIKVLKHFKDCMQKAESDYRELDDLIQTTLKSLEL
ncbi:WXG100 family type VII secretion target [Intestinibacter bartlettii]|uniref:ESAT-6-like protein n=1 Tax=Intestinibacter bartlettii TaxID=261299 RepID=A0ABS6DZR8_9FIRM|nr:WXG100 family type VII secretion target [Intestinibacter bartlettii]MBU5337329.1 WXG100 family type VII secretion target [Intestinibacter bartlettii]MDO5009348.1 WXG100 family type VII secretion target [Intestinibacter bartlettii]